MDCPWETARSAAHAGRLSAPRPQSYVRERLNAKRRVTAPPCRTGSFGSVKPPRERSVLFDHRSIGVDDLLAAVVAILGDMVATMHFAAGRIGGELHGLQRIVRKTHAAGGRGFAALGQGHGECPPRRYFF